MNMYDSFKERAIRFSQWRASEAYQLMCAPYAGECDRLAALGKDYMQAVLSHGEEPEQPIVREEYATGGNMHRGYYCPSPVQDLVVGGLSRGRLLKRVTKASNVSYRFGFDQNNRLIYAESLQKDRVITKEYIFHRDNRRIGIVMDREGDLREVSEELFEEQRLARYSYILLGSGYRCFELRRETYTYDDRGLKAVETEAFEPSVSVLQKWRYVFERQDGYLSAYTAEDLSLPGVDTDRSDLPVYTVSAKRKAAGDGLGGPG